MPSPRTKPAVAFNPTLGRNKSKLVAFAKEIRSLLRANQASGLNAETFQQLRKRACEQRVSLSVAALKLIVAENLLLDLVAQGWNISVRKQRITLRRSSESDSKDVIRQRHLLERDSQLRELSVSEFIHTMERKRLTSKGWHSIYSVMRDGQRLADQLRTLRDPTYYSAHLRQVIDPYIQFVEPGARCSETGLLLRDIWRYFRHTWVTPYKSLPGRSVSILVRDRACPGHPVIGIAALGSSVVQQSVRDKWIGWDSKSITQRLTEKPTRRFVRQLLKHLDRRISQIYKADLIKEAILSSSDLRNPSLALILLLRAESKKAMQLHRKYPDASTHKNRAAGSLTSWRKMARMHLFRSKRCRELAAMLSIRQTINDFRIAKANGHGLRQALKSSKVRQALAQIVRFLKAENVGVHMMDITVCGAIAPYNALLGGKLICTLLCSPEIIYYYRRKYKGQVSIIASGIRGREVRKSPKLVLLCTTSLYGSGSSQYNRLKIPLDTATLEYRELGCSEGFGSFHFSKETTRLIDSLLGRSAQGRKVNSIFGEGVNPLMRKMREALDMLGLSSDLFLRHGNKRIVYGVPLASNFRMVLSGFDSTPQYLIGQANPALQTRKLVDQWTTRWFKNRILNSDVLASVSSHTLSYPIRHGAQAPIERSEESLRSFSAVAS